jgi:hypothetical protein
MKLVVGRQVGATGTVAKGADTEVGFARELVDINGVESVFFTADFVTITRTPSVEWDTVLEEAVPILERAFGD